MMCEHELDHLPFTNQKNCRKCGKSEQEIELEQQLSAANARVAELEKQQFAGQTWVTFDEHMKALRKITQMEKDIAKIDDFEMVVVMNQKLSKNADSLSKALNDAIATARYHEQRAEKAEAQLTEAQATIDTHNETIERQHSEICRLNELLEMRCAGCHLRKESEVADNG